MLFDVRLYVPMTKETIRGVVYDHKLHTRFLRLKGKRVVLHKDMCTIGKLFEPLKIDSVLAPYELTLRECPIDPGASKKQVP